MVAYLFLFSKGKIVELIISMFIDSTGSSDRSENLIKLKFHSY